MLKTWIWDKQGLFIVGAVSAAAPTKFQLILHQQFSFDIYLTASFLEHYRQSAHSSDILTTALRNECKNNNLVLFEILILSIDEFL